MGEEPCQGVCQCCMMTGMFDSVNLLSNVDYDNGTYVDMLASCFKFNTRIPITYLKEGRYYICDLCIISLREAFVFKSQVVETQRVLSERQDEESESFKEEVVFTNVTIKDENSASDSTDWNLEYLEEYEEIVKNNPLQDEPPGSESSLQDGKIFNSGITEKELKGPYSETRWTQYLTKKTCNVKMQCLVCMEKFHNLHVLKQHLNVHYPVFTCKRCGKSFANKQRINKHVTVHIEGEFRCKQCEKLFDTKSKWVCHVATHKKSMRHHCRFCPERFHDYQQRIKHEVADHNQPKKPFSCKHCSSTFGMAVHLSMHVRRVHLKERNKVCNVCGKDFFGMKGLSKHMIVHTAERTFKCEKCFKGYPRLKTLREHMKIHTNERRFICRVCDRSFTQKCTLKVHMKTHEKDVDNFEEIHEKDDKSGLVYIYMDYKKQLS